MKNLEILYTQFFAVLSIVLACFFAPSVQAANINDLLITEIMANPDAVSDGNGEWFELFNPTNESIDLSGITLSDDTGNSTVLSADASLLVNPGSYFVLARNGDSASNGGFEADYVYSNFALRNSSDQIVFSNDSGELLRFDYGSGFVPRGSSMELIDSVMLLENFAQSATAYGLGDLGTPGAAGAFIQPSAISNVPLPAAAWLMGSGLLGLVGFSRRRSS